MIEKFHSKQAEVNNGFLSKKEQSPKKSKIISSFY